MRTLAQLVLSQSSLNDYRECPRRFYLRYLAQAAWPAAQAEPVRENERHLRRGAQFHRLVQQYLSGIGAEQISQIAACDPDPLLAQWWQAFIEQVPARLQNRPAGPFGVETRLFTWVGPLRLVAQYDLVVMEADGSVTIYDWKTCYRANPRPAAVLESMQSKVYPLVMATAGSRYGNGKPVAPQAIRMVYWYTSDVMPWITLAYSPERMAQDRAEILQLSEEICQRYSNGKVAADHPGGESDKNCRYCVYRSYCDRGVTAGPLAAGLDADSWLDSAAIEQIEELTIL